ncbi:MAG: hypothetical protein J6Q47_02900 [Paludibacteraceae bacterium]|nr:hypothetical protein [Paludibacteraceae bacterium]
MKLTNDFSIEELVRLINDETLPVSHYKSVKFDNYTLDDFRDIAKGIKTNEKKNLFLDAVISHLHGLKQQVENAEYPTKEIELKNIVDFIQGVEEQKGWNHYYPRKTSNYIKSIQKEQCVLFDDGRCGYFQFFDGYGMHFAFYSCCVIDLFCIRDGTTPVFVCEGFVAYVIHNYKKIDTNELFDSYTQLRLEQYKNSHRHDLDLFKRNLENEFFVNFISEEKKRIDNSKNVFEYLPQQEQEIINSYVDAYFEYVGTIVNSHIDKSETETENKALQGRKSSKSISIDEERLKSYFVASFKGFGNSENKFDEFVLDLKSKTWNKREISTIALIIYESKEFNSRTIKTFSKWLEVFCECMNCDKTTYRKNFLNGTENQDIKRNLDLIFGIYLTKKGN